MPDVTFDDKAIKKTLKSSKIIAMVGVSSIKKEDAKNIIRRPSIIVMSYLQEFGYKVIPINPFAAGKKINGETVLEKLEDVSEKIDIVNVFRRSEYVLPIIKDAIKINANAIWLQDGVISHEGEKLAKENDILFIMNDCLLRRHRQFYA